MILGAVALACVAAFILIVAINLTDPFSGPRRPRPPSRRWLVESGLGEYRFDSKTGKAVFKETEVSSLLCEIETLRGDLSNAKERNSILLERNGDLYAQLVSLEGENAKRTRKKA